MNSEYSLYTVKETQYLYCSPYHYYTIPYMMCINLLYMRELILLLILSLLPTVYKGCYKGCSLDRVTYMYIEYTVTYRAIFKGYSGNFQRLQYSPCTCIN